MSATAQSTVWSFSPFKLWTILALAWFATMSWRPILEPDEGRYAEIPREMSESGDWVTPRLNGFKYFEKPPLQYWATAASYGVLGVSEGSSRLWSCLLAFLCLPMVYYFARSAYGSRSAGAAALLALSINPYFPIVGQINLLDSALAFFLSATLFAYWRARESAGVAERRWMLIAALALALATLSKGLVALVLAGGTVLLHMLVTRNALALRRWHLQWTVPVYLAVTSPWFVGVSLRNPEFPEFFFVREHFSRYLTDISDRVQPFWYFLPILLIAVLPWMRQFKQSFLPLARASPRHPSVSLQWFLVIWCLFALVFFSLSQSKLATYILPLMPALAVIVAPQIAERMERVRAAAWICCAVITLTAIALVVVGARRSPVVSSALVTWASVATALALAGAAAARVNWLIPVLTTILAFQALMVSYTDLPSVRTAKPLLANVRAFIRPDTQLFSVDQYRQSIPPYLGRTLRLALYKGELDFGITQEPSRFIATLAEFEAQWRHASDAIAFVDPPLVGELASRGIAFREIARDDRTIVISRN